VRVLEQGKSALSFHYGVKPIEEHIAKVRAAAPEGCTILPLHSKLRREEQRAAIEPRPRKAVAATNTAQTSITIDGMDVVIITGEVRRLVLDDEGIPSLIIDQITQDEHKQQMGRVGRTGHGFVISHAKPFNELKPHAPSEIQNMSLETIILRCAAAKIPFRKLNRYLIDQAPEKHIKLGYRVLYDLGLVGPKGDITALGKSVAKLPCDARMGKLLVKASEYQETHKVAILDDAIRIAAVVESEGILSGEGRGWQRLGGKEKNSDLIKQGRVFQRAQEISPEQRDSLGIDEVNFQRACDIERMLRRKMELPETAPPRKTPEANESSMGRSLRIAEETRERLWLSRAIIEAHVDSIFRLIGRNEAGDYRYKPLTKKNQAVLQKDSVVRGAKLLIGSRFNIGFLDSDGYQRIQPLLLNAHRVDDDLLWLELATPPHLHRQNKDGIAKVLLSPQRKNERMRSRDFRKGRSHRNGKHGHGHGNA
jgi:HrpA-like RNA helicase